VAPLKFLRREKMAKSTSDTRQKVAVALLIEIDGSSVQNRLTAFELPITGLTEGNSEAPGIIEFETKDLKAAIIAAVNKL
jgi:hypothetical protein